MGSQDAGRNGSSAVVEGFVGGLFVGWQLEFYHKTAVMVGFFVLTEAPTKKQTILPAVLLDFL